MPRARFSLAPALIGGALGSAIACGTFGTTPGEDARDAGRAAEDVAAIDASACAKPLVSVVEKFDGTTFPPLLWQKGTNTGGTVTRVTDDSHSPPASFRAEGTADAKGIEAQIEHNVDVEPLTIDLRYAMSSNVPSGVYAEIGCTIRLAHAPQYDDVTRLALAVERDGRLQARPRGIVGGTDFGDRHFVFSSVEPGWHEVHEVATVTSSGVDVTITVVSPSGVSKVVTYATERPVTVNRVGIHCGIDAADVAADAGAAVVTALVDDIAFDICPR